MDIINILQWRYAAKKFDASKKLPQEKLEILKQAFNLTATSYGLQPVKLLIVENRHIREQLVEHSWNQRQVADASHLFVFCIHEDVDADYIHDYFNRVMDIRKTPKEVLDPFRKFLVEDFENKTTEEIYNWAVKQAYLIMGNLLTVCALEGIDSCPMEGFNPEQYDNILKLKEKRLKSVLVMPVGYRADNDMFADFKKVRKPLSESIEEIK